MQGQNLTLKPFLYIRSCSSYSLHSLHTKNLPQITRINTDFNLHKLYLCKSAKSVGDSFYAAEIR